MKKQGCDGDGEKEEDGQDQVWQRIWEALEEFNVAKDFGILLCRLGKEAAKGRADDRSQTPDDGHDGECSGLEFSFWHHLGNHCSNDTNYKLLARLQIY